MKTTTYLRFSLLIPLVVWGICLLFLLLVNAIPETSALAVDESQGITELVFLFLAFYIFGIIVWIIPYVLLALILFFWSFISRAKTALKVFTLSPLAMTILTVAALNILKLGTTDENSLFSSPGVIDQDLIDLNVLGIAFALIWGYMCVGIGFGIYKILQKRGVIRDEESAQIASTSDQPA